MKKSINFKQNPAILNTFLWYLLCEKNYSIYTVKSYENDLSIFFRFIIEYKGLPISYINMSIFSLVQINKPDILAFLVYMNYHRNNSAYTRQRRLCSIKAFFKWLSINNPGIEVKNPADEIKSIMPHYRLPKHLSLEQAKEIQEIFTLKNSKTPVRNNAILSLFLSTGMRISELIGINIDDINLEDKSIKILGKGRKQRIVYFSEYCKKQLNKYLDIRLGDNNAKDYDALFLNWQHKRIGVNGVENVCKKAFKLAEIEGRGFTTHTLRHTSATIMYRYVSQDILLIKQFLGHSSILSTQIYTHVYNKEVKNAVDSNPLNKYAEELRKRKMKKNQKKITA